MQFSKDILLFDLETDGNKPGTSRVLQIGAVLLDKETLEEKASYVSYVKQDLSDADPDAMQINGIKPAQLAGAPSEEIAAKEFLEKFGTDVLIGSWCEYLDRRLLMEMFRRSGVDWNYDLHYLDFWPIAYADAVKKGYNGSVRSQPIFEFFGLGERGAHNALEDCRMEAEVFRKVMKS